MKLSSKKIRFLRGLGHHLAPVAMVGQAGVTEKVILSIKADLKTHELIKVKIQSNAPADRHDIADALGKATGAAIVQVLGKTILLFLENKKRRPDQKIILPD
ncbi:MAG: ribosome assembly RNA-binding protein YhbY [Desulfobulbaceae bacterium]|uniref:Ribosome assembly RNA-binding protein YhbY n=1 Tax=Candidatus Desulfobia pelagia TaxID=2841692 RepID=A0A8J6NER6_9BACT|nr:ribosome assembly RNA-binding protein YhbY [Candidatus Desulfobia pelagia]